MAELTTVAVAGASGQLGKPLVSLFIKSGHYSIVRILVRQGTIDKPEFQEYRDRSGVEIVEVDYENPDSVLASLKDIQLVVSCVAKPGQITNQLPLAKAAHTAGVKLFIPSDFGQNFPTYGDPNDRYVNTPVLYGKYAFFKLANEINLPQASFAVGNWMESLITPRGGFDFAARKVTIYGTGEPPVSWAVTNDIARYVDHILRTVPLKEALGKKFRMQGDRQSPNDIVRLWEQKYGEKLEVTYKPISEIHKLLDESEGNNFLASLWNEWANGRGAFPPDEVDNHYFPDWNPKKVVDYI
ncbi:NAD(P)-binding protein [Sistotremastrum niveocremeum HHB9708]|uniref:NAD(P)-binding protein n=1 Tax=Sistotremastrum niveocremeum HHB9708 TaxID=1314777 RepID=A0A164MAN6_9AGAM|nr:NAD(P)-binding protein [Sistotremastrum niveocremeum HHB9708]